MNRTLTVVVEGQFLGAVVPLADDWSFVAADPVVADLHGGLFPSPEEATRIAGLVRDRARMLPTSLPVLRPPPARRVVRGQEPDTTP